MAFLIFFYQVNSSIIEKFNIPQDKKKHSKEDRKHDKEKKHKKDDKKKEDRKRDEEKKKDKEKKEKVKVEPPPTPLKVELTSPMVIACHLSC